MSKLDEMHVDQWADEKEEDQRDRRMVDLEGVDYEGDDEDVVLESEMA